MAVAFEDLHQCELSLRYLHVCSSVCNTYAQFPQAGFHLFTTKSKPYLEPGRRNWGTIFQMSSGEMFLNVHIPHPSVPCEGSSIQTWSKYPLDQKSESPKFTIKLIQFVKNAIGSLKIMSKYFMQLFVILGLQSLKLHKILMGHLWNLMP